MIVFDHGTNFAITIDYEPAQYAHEQCCTDASWLIPQTIGAIRKGPYFADEGAGPDSEDQCAHDFGAPHRTGSVGSEISAVGSGGPEMLQKPSCWSRFLRNRNGIDTNSRYNQLSKR
ncbi:hypothetical protein GGD65_006069 [Bradyrhizobium sp. CIR18]|uniref:hypothetical protein n=1 Tax=Bradyrhizobium sp. CIR18 TaxID=2663839 RepID=UPI0016066DF7|nr:hypothetical protein [Bradyrhizobium sp. CIR18]MBB4365005.1 hypothetical protein [Bradyrhizobium sp. CIR18]